MLLQSDINRATDPATRSRVFLFGPFILDVSRSSLMRDGLEIPLRPKAFKVLTCLLEHPGRLVRRGELLEKVWPGLVVTDDSLTQCLVEIRRALGDEKHTIVRTAPRRGYLFELPVAVSTAADASHAERPQYRRQRPSAWTIVAVAILTIAIGATWSRMGHQTGHPASGLPTAGTLDVPNTEPVPGARNPEAWKRYLRGKYFYGRRADGDTILAQREFEAALRLDPELSHAWISLAGTLYLRSRADNLPEEEKLPLSETLPLVRQAIEKTLELDPHHPEALMRLTRLLWKEGEFEHAFRQLSLAMQYGRNDPLVQSMLATWAFRISGLDSSLHLQHRAVLLDPVNVSYFINLAYLLFVSGRLDESAAALRQASEINPDLGLSGKETLALILIQQRNYDLADSLAQEIPEGPVRDYIQGMLQHQAGNEEEANAALQRLIGYGDPASLARLAYVYAYRGEVDSAFRTLDAFTKSMAAMQDRYTAEFLFMDLKISSFLQSLHGDSRWLEWTTATESLLHHPYYEGLAETLQRYAATGIGVEGPLSQEKRGGL